MDDAPSNAGTEHLEIPKEQVGRTVVQAPRFDEVEIVDQKQEHVTVAGIERRRILRDNARDKPSAA